MVSLATPTPLLIRSPCESTSSSVQDQPPPSKLPANTCPASVASHARSGVGRAIAVKRAPIEAWLGGVMLRNTPPALRQSNARPLPPTMAEPSGAMPAAYRSRVVPQLSESPLKHLTPALGSRRTEPDPLMSAMRPLLPTTTPSPDALAAIALAAEEAVTTDPGSQPGTLSRSHPARRS